jgi:hypothetical protein
MEDKFAGYAAAERWAKLGRGREKCLANWERREYIERETEGGERDRKQREDVVWVTVLMDFGKWSVRVDEELVLRWMGKYPTIIE